MYLFFDRLIEEGENFVLYSYPSCSRRGRTLLSMRGLLSVLEGAVAAVTGQRAQIAVLDEQDDGDGHGVAIAPALALEKGRMLDPDMLPPPLKVRACTRELGGIGRGIAFVLLCWHPLVRDEHLRALTSNLLRCLRASVGPLHSALFKPFELLSAAEEAALETAKASCAASGASKKGLRKPSKLQPFWTALQRHVTRGRRPPELHDDDEEGSSSDDDSATGFRPSGMTVVATVASMDMTAATVTALHPPVTAAHLLPSLTATNATSSPPAAAALPHAAELDVLPSDLRWPLLQAQWCQRALAHQPSVRPDAPVAAVVTAVASVDGAEASDPELSPRSAARAQEQLLRAHTVHSCSWESLRLLDSFFAHVDATVGAELLATASGMAAMAAMAVPAPAAAAPPHPPASALLITTPPSKNSWATDVARMHLNPFLSPSLVPQGAPTASRWTRIVAERLATLLAAYSRINGSSQYTMMGANAATPPLSPLGVLLFQDGALVHVERATSSVSMGASVPASRLLRNQDVHELCNLTILQQLLRRSPNARPPNNAAAKAPPTIVHASVQQLWLSYAPFELSEQEAEKYHITLPSPFSPTAESTAATVRSSPQFGGHTHNVTSSIPSLSLQSSASVSAAAAAPSSSPLARSMSVAARSPANRRTGSVSGMPFPIFTRPPSAAPPAAKEDAAAAAATSAVASDAAKKAGAAATVADPSVFTDSEVFLTRLAGMLKMMCPQTGSELALVLVLDAPTPRMLAHMIAQAAEAAAAGSLMSEMERAQAFFFAFSALQPSLMKGALDDLCLQWSSLASTSGLQTGTLSSVPAKQALTALVELARDDGSGVPRSPVAVFSPTSATGGSAAASNVTHALHARSQSMASLSFAPGTLNAPFGAPLASSSSHAAHNIVPPIPISHQGHGAGVLHDFVLLHHGRGMVVRPAPVKLVNASGVDVAAVVGASPASSPTSPASAVSPAGISLGGLSSPPPVPAPSRSSLLSPRRGSVSAAANAVPESLERDFLAATAQMHQLFQRFQTLYLNMAGGTGAADASLVGGGPSTLRRSNSISGGIGAGVLSPTSPLAGGGSDPYASSEELGRGNQVYWRRHKGMETLRMVHESGTRLLYPSSGRAFWVRGRLLSNGNEVYVCCDDALPADVLDTAWKAMMQ
jgi:hypothetical protein